MELSTTSEIAGKTVYENLGLVFGEAIMGANVVRDFVAGITDFIGGRSGVYESKIQDARDTAVAEIQSRAASLGANAVIGLKFDYGTVGDSMMMVSVVGTAVKVK